LAEVERIRVQRTHPPNEEPLIILLLYIFLKLNRYLVCLKMVEKYFLVCQIQQVAIKIKYKLKVFKSYYLYVKTTNLFSFQEQKEMPFQRTVKEDSFIRQRRQFQQFQTNKEDSYSSLHFKRLCNGFNNNSSNFN